jgi:hypothetical protein
MVWQSAFRRLCEEKSDGDGVGVSFTGGVLSRVWNMGCGCSISMREVGGA